MMIRIRSKLFPGCPSHKKSEISLIYQSATESTFGPGLSSSQSRGQYERISVDGDIAGTSTSAATEHKEGIPKSHNALKLDGNIAGPRACRFRVVRLQRLIKAPSTLICRMKEQYAIWKEGARRSNLRISDLFVANQLFMHVQTTPVNSRRKQHTLKPSVGFVNRVPGPSAGKREMRER